MTADPRRVVDDLEAKIVDESAALDLDDEPSQPSADDASPETPGVEPTD